MAMKSTATLTIDRYVAETLMPDLVGHDRKPSAFLVYLALLAVGDGGEVALSYAELSDRTGLSRSAVRGAVAWLERRELVAVRSDGPTETRRYRPLAPWQRLDDPSPPR
jgi:DNA-binding transcriptional ArsR family regulator